MISLIGRGVSGRRALMVLATLFVASCSYTKKAEKPPGHINNETKFSSEEYGVKSSPRITTAKRVKKGGGRYQVGKPYTIRGKKYYPKEEPGYVATGMASWYGPNFHGRLTANGEIYDQYSLSAAHPTMPLPSYAKVTNLENGSSVMVRVNDRGPFARGRVIDLSARASELLGFQSKGLARVRVEYAGRARMDGLDEKFLVASYRPNGLGPTGLPSNNQTLLAENSVPRTTLARLQSNNIPQPTGFVPVPQARPTIWHGIPMDIVAGLATPRPTLVAGYVDDTAINARIAQAFAMVDTGPKRGMSNLVHITFGPFANADAIKKAEALLADDGVLQQIDVPGGKALLLITAQEQSAELLKKISAAGLKLAKRS